MKKEAPLKKQGAQKISEKKRGTPKKCKRLKRSPMKKEAPLKAKCAKKDLHPEGRMLLFK
jgi:hypothetical protein